MGYSHLMSPMFHLAFIRYECRERIIMSSAFPMGDLIVDGFIHGSGLRFHDLPIGIDLENSNFQIVILLPSIIHHPSLSAVTLSFISRAFRPPRMRIAILQTSPSLGAVQQNIARATSLLTNVPREPSLDLIILPELAFTGYNFQTPEQIRPFVETRMESPSREWAKHVAKDFACSVLVGLPTQENDARYNTATLVNSTGDIVHEYHKHHMFSTDYSWGCQAGPGFTFTTLQIDGRKIRTTIGICMDLNPWEYIASQTAYEFANYILRNDIQLILIPMAWLYPEDLDRKCMKFSEATLTYWMKRLHPVVWDTRWRIVVCCNRTGEEEGAVYAGTSAVCRVGNGKVHLLKVMGREEGVITVDVAL